jgi:hypothetical protein
VGGHPDVCAGAASAAFGVRAYGVRGVAMTAGVHALFGVLMPFTRE